VNTHPHHVIQMAQRNISRFLNAGVAALFTGYSAFALAQITITPPVWNFAQETVTGYGTFVNGPGVPPSGSTGSVQLTVLAPGGEFFYTQQFAGTPLAQITGLTYNSYVVSSAIPETMNLQFDFDPGLTPATTGYQGRAVFTPTLMVPQRPVQVGVWQTWNPMTERAWWGSTGAAPRALATACTQALPCTWAEILAAFPNAKVLAAPSAFGFKLGNSNRAAVVSVDSFSIGTTGLGGPVTQYNFALVAPVQCVPGTFSATGNAPCTSASLGYFVAAAGATAELPCIAGSYAGVTGASSCTLASPGSFVANGAASAQVSCSAGSFAAVQGLTVCTPAAANFYVPISGAVAQIPCALGTTSAGGATLCTGLPILNIDDSDPPTKYDAGTDGALLMRYLLGVRGTALTDGVLGNNAQRDAIRIANHISTYRLLFDVDGDGQTAALTDGVMIVRRLLGLSGVALTANAKNTSRSDTDIAAAIDALRP
jgi:hypothetical protein